MRGSPLRTRRCWSGIRRRACRPQVASRASSDAIACSGSNNRVRPSWPPAPPHVIRLGHGRSPPMRRSAGLAVGAKQTNRPWVAIFPIARFWPRWLPVIRRTCAGAGLAAHFNAGDLELAAPACRSPLTLPTCRRGTIRMLGRNEAEQRGRRAVRADDAADRRFGRSNARGHHGQLKGMSSK